MVLISTQCPLLKPTSSCDRIETPRVCVQQWVQQWQIQVHKHQQWHHWTPCRPLPHLHQPMPSLTCRASKPIQMNVYVSPTLAHHIPLHPFNLAKLPECQTANQGSVSGYFRPSFLLNLIYIFTIAHNNNWDLCTLLYHYITIPLSPLSFCSLLFSVPLCEGTYRTDSLVISLVR